ncbi:MAG: YpfJ protein, zinc metalloprotease superfamily, partial [uncultured Nocardioidaceae bacterium]
ALQPQGSARPQPGAGPGPEWRTQLRRWARRARRGRVGWWRARREPAADPGRRRWPDGLRGLRAHGDRRRRPLRHRRARWAARWGRRRHVRRAVRRLQRPRRDLHGRHRSQRARAVPDRRGRQHRPLVRAPGRRQQRPGVLGAGAAGPGGPVIRARDDQLLHRLGRHRLRAGDLGHRPLLLPGRRRRLPRHHLLRRDARRAARGGGRPVLGGLRPGPRVRPPRAGPSRHHGQGPHPAGREQRRRPPRAAGRLLRRHVDEVRHRGGGRERGGVHPRPHPGRHRPGPGRRCRRRRRPDPGEVRPGRPRDLDPRLGAGPAVLVLRRHGPGDARGVRHLQRVRPRRL